MTQTDQPALVRAIGRWSLAALVVNSIIGSSVFGLPSVFAGLVGSASLLAITLPPSGLLARALRVSKQGTSCGCS